MRARGRSLFLALLLAGTALAGPQGPHTAGTKGGPHAATSGPAIVSGPAAGGGVVVALLAAWMLDEAAGAARVNWQGTTSRNMLERGGTLANNTTQKMEGAASVEATSGIYLSSTDTTLRTLTPPFTCGFWARSTGTGNQNALYGSVQGCCGGFVMYYGGDEIWRATLQDAAFGGVTVTAPSAIAPNVWAHLALVVNAGSSALFENGASVATQTFTYVVPASSSEFAVTGSAAGHFAPGEIDELWCYTGALSAPGVCRICSCGVRGEQCTCNGAAYTSNGRNATACGSCVLPACNAAPS